MLDSEYSNMVLVGICLTSSGEDNILPSLRLEDVFFRRWGDLVESVQG
jgi:hypothetical protein